MNTNLSLGIITFVVWSAFSTWYYVNYIKDFGEANALIMDPRVEKQETNADIDTIPSKEQAPVNEETGIKIDLEQNFQFKINSAELIDPLAFNSFYDSLQEVVGDSKIAVTVTGYACDLGTSEYNMDLSRERARQMADQLRSSQINVASIDFKGENDPLLPNTNEANRALNRRVELKFTSE